MPKLIPELRERFIAVARHRILDGDSGKMTIRQIALDCGTATGTVYNYFPSKQVLIAAVIQEDWEACIERMSVNMDAAQTPLEGLRGICAALRNFTMQHSVFWDHYSGPSITRGKLASYHQLVTSQIDVPVRALLTRFDKLYDSHAPLVIADILLYAARTEDGFELAKPTLEKLLL